MGARALVFMLIVAASVTGLALAQSSAVEEGRVGPEKKLLVSGRKLDPYGKLTQLGNFPAGGALTPNGRFLWTLSAGRGRNDIRIVEVGPALRCRKGARGRACRKRRSRRIGRVVQTIEMPGVNGGIAMSPDNRTAYVSGTPESSSKDQAVADDVPGQDGDVIHVFRYNGRRGTAKRDGVIEVPPPSDSPTVQAFPPSTARQSWPRDLSVSRDGKTLLAALNLADYAAVIDTAARKARFVKVGGYPYGAAILRDGRRGLVSNAVDGTVSVIDLERARKVKDITVGPHLSHPQGIAIDPKQPRAYVALANQDLVAVIDTDKLEVERTLSVARPEGIGSSPTHLSVTRDGRRLLVANSGEDAIAVFALPQPVSRRERARRSRAETAAQRVLLHEGRVGIEESESEEEERAELYGEEFEERAEAAQRRRPVRRRPRAFELIGRVPTAHYPTAVAATPRRERLVWVAAKGLGTGPNTPKPGETIPEDTGSATAGADPAYRFHYLPTRVFGHSGIARFPTDAGLRRLTPRAARQIRPVNGQKPPAGTPITEPGPGRKIEHVFYVVRENRTYDQILGDDPRGDGDPKLTLFGEKITPNAHALAKRFPLLDHVYANSEASIDGHFWTAAAAVSDYVNKSWHQNYGGRDRPYDFGVYAVTWPAARFLFDQAEKQGISWFNYGEAIAGTAPLPDRNRNDEETREVAAKFAKSDLGVPNPPNCFPNDASSGGIDEVLSAGPAPDVEVYDSSLPAGAPPTAESRFDCFKRRFQQQVADGNVPAFNYMTFANDHTAGTTPGRRTPRAMIAENDYALGQIVELISNSPVWSKSLILVIEDDSQDGADHVDAHRIPAFAISPYAKRGAVVHTRYDFLSFIRTLEIVLGMKPLNLFDSVAVPLYDAFDAEPGNSEPYKAIVPDVNLVERNTEATPMAARSRELNIGPTDRTPQRYLDEILWKYVHGEDSEAPPPGPNASGLDEAAFERYGRVAQPGDELEEEEGE